MPEKLTQSVLQEIEQELPKEHRDRRLREDEESRKLYAALPKDSEERTYLSPGLGYMGVELGIGSICPSTVPICVSTRLRPPRNPSRLCSNIRPRSASKWYGP